MNLLFILLPIFLSLGIMLWILALVVKADQTDTYSKKSWLASDSFVKRVVAVGCYTVVANVIFSLIFWLALSGLFLASGSRTTFLGL